tara:strand:+ start:77500 stop:77952 length:453 start_codon:yes stop_codon:yes gene_type:complete
MTENNQTSPTQRWIVRGIAHGFAIPEVCYTHDGVPTTTSEDDAFDTEGQYTCFPLVRLYEAEEVRSAVESFSPTTDCTFTPRSAHGHDNSVMGYSQWLAEGVAEGLIGQPVCFAHDTVPMTADEVVDDDPCIHVLRLLHSTDQRLALTRR